MDNIGDWIYLIIFGIAAVSGLFVKKKRENQPTSSPKPVVKKTEAPLRPAAQQANNKSVTASHPADFGHNAIPDDEPVVLLETEEEPHAPTLDIRNAEEIRKAVIYSEILRRRY